MRKSLPWGRHAPTDTVTASNRATISTCARTHGTRGKTEFQCRAPSTLPRSRSFSSRRTFPPLKGGTLTLETTRRSGHEHFVRPRNERRRRGEKGQSAPHVEIV